MTKRNPEFDGFSAYFAVRAETDRKGKSTPPARTETPTYQQQMSHHNISTHSAHEDGDLALDKKYTDGDAISTHSAHEDGDQSVLSSMYRNFVFQPTPPTRTETLYHQT